MACAAAPAAGLCAAPSASAAAPAAVAATRTVRADRLWRRIRGKRFAETRIHGIPKCESQSATPLPRPVVYGPDVARSCVVATRCLSHAGERPFAAARQRSEPASHRHLWWTWRRNGTARERGWRSRAQQREEGAVQSDVDERERRPGDNGTQGRTSHAEEGRGEEEEEEGEFEEGNTTNGSVRAAGTSDSRDEQYDSSEEEVGADGSGADFRGTLQLVETAMLAATGGLAFFLANNLRIESYFGFFFPLPSVICAMRWGVPAGLQCTMATALLLFVLSGPLKAVTFLLLHGFVGATLGVCWRIRLPWPVSIVACAAVRCAGAVGFVFLSSWLIQDNILKLILRNVQASITLVLSTLGSNVLPSMTFVTGLFTFLLLFNCCAFSLLLHLLYSLFLKRLGMDTPTKLPPWLERAM